MPPFPSSARGLGLQQTFPPPMRNSQGFQFYPGRRLPVVCRDGVTRSAVITGQADTWFSIPAAVQVYAGGKRRTVSGTVYPLPFSRLLSFYATGANAALIPWTAHKPRLAAAALRLIKATAYGKGAGHKWDLPSDHAAALAAACREWSVAWYSTPELGWQATAEFKRIKPDVLPRLALFFDRLGRFQSAAGE